MRKNLDRIRRLELQTQTQIDTLARMQHEGESSDRSEEVKEYNHSADEDDCEMIGSLGGLSCEDDPDDQLKTRQECYQYIYNDLFLSELVDLVTESLATAKALKRKEAERVELLNEWLCEFPDRQ
jgi:hypothetical protein